MEIQIKTHKKFFLKNCIYYSYLAALIGWNLIGINRYICFGIMMFSGSMALGYVMAYRPSEKLHKMFLFYGIFTSFGFICSLFSQNRSFLQVLYIWPQIGMGLLIIYTDFSRKIMTAIYYGTSFVYMIRIVTGVRGYGIHTQGGVMPIAIIILLLVLLLYILCLKQEKMLSVLPAYTGLFVAIMARERAGILSFILLSLVLTVWDQRKNKFTFNRNIIVSVLALLIITIAFERIFIEYLQAALFRFQNESLTGSRAIIWNAYLELLRNKAEYIFTGVPTTAHRYFVLYSENFHNSFINLHAEFGICGFVQIIGVLIYAMVQYVRQREWMFLWIFLVFLIRCCSDLMLFGRNGDFIFIFLIWYPFLKGGKKYGENTDLLMGKRFR